MAVVLDASALVFALRSSAPSASALRARLAGELVAAPHLIDAEVGDVVRREVLQGSLDAERGVALLAAGARLVDIRHATDDGLRAAAWQLREKLTFYDALYAALAGAWAVPLLTVDRRLAGAPGLPCRVELVA